MKVCGRCGVIRYDSKTCGHCAGLGPFIDVPTRADGAYWVCVLATFKCRACAFVVPLNHVDMGGVVLCAHCGLEQTFAVESWRIALEHAHATGDLWGARGEWRDREEANVAVAKKMFASIGRARWSAELPAQGPNALAITACPGVALCASCQLPLDVKSAELRSEVRCAGCGSASTYSVPVLAREVLPTLSVILAIDHRVDREVVKVAEAGQAAIGLVCPSCNAPLPMPEESRLVTCSYCHAGSRIPDRTWFRISGKPPKSEPIWFLLMGSSARRIAIDKARTIEDEAIVARQHRNEVAARLRKERAAKK